MLSASKQIRLDVSKRVWGPVIWYIIHKASLIATHTQFSNLLRLLSELLPCALCRTNMRNYIRLYPLKPGEVTFIWAIAFHNSVNDHQLKKAFPETHYKLLKAWDIILEMDNGPSLADLTEVVGIFFRLINFRWKAHEHQMTLVIELRDGLKKIFPKLPIEDLKDGLSTNLSKKTIQLARAAQSPNSRYITVYSKKI